MVRINGLLTLVINGDIPWGEITHWSYNQLIPNFQRDIPGIGSGSCCAWICWVGDFLLRGFDPMANQHVAPLFGRICLRLFPSIEHANPSVGANVDVVFLGKGRKTIDNLKVRRVTSASWGYLQWPHNYWGAWSNVHHGAPETVIFKIDDRSANKLRFASQDLHTQPSNAKYATRQLTSNWPALLELLSDPQVVETETVESNGLDVDLRGV